MGYLRTRIPRKHAKVDINSIRSVQKWCREFRCTESQLEEAVRRVGSLVPDVQRALEQRPHSRPGMQRQ